MLIDASKLRGFPVLSLHAEGLSARIEEEIVNPENLKVVAFKVWGEEIRNDPELGTILETRDVREFSPMGMVVDSAGVFVEEGDVIKLDKILKLNFSLLGLSVETKKKSKLGKVVDFVIETDDFSVRQLIVKRPLVKSFFDPELVIPRKEIVEITDYKIIVKDEEDKIKARALREDFTPNFVNPFREPDFSANRIAKEKKN
ncbi:PRC-barrel domain-containing protein [Candidatus Saccharibacteria bacterium]|nr:PRC-barrel domain-containing protein [Candidatus Saccharibacteria bacterium]